MLTDLSWLSNGQPWPPKDPDEAARLAEHRRNRMIYNGQHDQVFSKYFQYLQDRSFSDKKLLIILDWPRNATRKLLSLTTGDAPGIMVEGADLTDLIPNLIETLDEVSTDWCRYGIGIFELSHTEDSSPRIESWSPENVLIVVKRGDIRAIQAYVLHYTFVEDGHTYLKVKIHEPGRVRHQIFEIVGPTAKLVNSRDAPIPQGSLRGPLDISTIFPGMDGTEALEATDVNDFAVLCMHNTLTTERYYGRSDYGPDVQTLLEALELAFARRQETLAIHSRPTDVVPESACSYDHALQRWVYRPGETIVYQPGEDPSGIKKLVWDAQLGAVERQIEDLMNQLIVMLDLSHELLSEKNEGRAVSGTALRIRLIPTLARVKKLKSVIHKTVVELLSAANQMKGSGPINDSQVSILWKDGIPEDPLEAANARSVNASTVANLVASKIIDQETGLKMLADLGCREF